MTEQSLIQRCQSGDQNAFAELLEAHYDAIYATAWRWCGDPVNAEDITQNACLKLARSIQSFDGKAKFSTWLHRLIINCAKDFYKSPTQHNVREGSDHALDHISGTNPDHTNQLAAQQMLAKIGELPEDLSQTLILVFFHGMTHQKAGQALGVKAATVSWRIHESRKLLTELQNQAQDVPHAALSGETQ